jgi:tetrahydromethanopterin S-methyltransferase subunit H
VQHITNDPRILFVCLDYPDFIDHVQSIVGHTREELNKSLDSFVSEIINAKVEINIMNREIRMPRVFETYASDFGNTQAVLEFVYRYLKDPEIDLQTCIDEVTVKRNIYILYQ